MSGAGAGAVAEAGVQEKKQWTVRGISPQTIKQVKILSVRYGITNGEVVNRLVGAAYRQREGDEVLEVFSDFGRLSLLDEEVTDADG